MAEEHLIPYEKKPLMIQNQVVLPVQYEVVNGSYYSFMWQINQDTTVRLDESTNEASQSDCIDEEYEKTIRDSAKPYYTIAVASGLLSGAMSWVDLNEIVNHVNWKKKDIQDLLVKAAKIAGYKKNDYKGAVKFVKSRVIPIVDEHIPETTREVLQWFCNSLSSNASVVGFVFSIVEQFSGEKCSLDEKSNYTFKPLPEYYAVGKTVEEKIFYGLLYWVFALLTNAVLSKKAILEELRIPKGLIDLLKRLSELPMFQSAPKCFEDFERMYSKWIQKTFEESTVVDVDGNVTSFKFASMFKDLAEGIINQSIPIVLNECVFRGFYSLRQLYLEVSNKKLNTIGDLEKIDPQTILPYNNQIVSHMAVIASGVFLATNMAGAVVRTALEYDKNADKSFGKQFLAHVSIAGIGRFIIAVANDSKYWGKNAKVIITRKDNKKNIFETILCEEENDVYEILGLSPKQARLQYCLESFAVKYDIQHTEKPDEAKLKELWLKEWQQDIVEGFRYKEDGFFDVEEDALYDYLIEQGRDDSNKRWIYLLSMELALFEPYHLLGTQNDPVYKKLKANSNYIEDQFIRRQIVVSQKELDALKKEYKRAYGAISGKTQSTLIAAGAAVATIVVSGGLAFAFAPEIAVAIAGEAVVGLHGAALTSASLAFVGGGALAAGGAGMAGGTAVITGGGALLGLAGSGSASAVTLLFQTPAGYWPRQGAKLVTYTKVVLCDCLHDEEKGTTILNASKKALDEAKTDLESLKEDKCEYDKEAIKKLAEYYKSLLKTEKELEKICK